LTVGGDELVCGDPVGEAAGEDAACIAASLVQPQNTAKPVNIATVSRSICADLPTLA
jgi:hypothetical protein